MGRLTWEPATWPGDPETPALVGEVDGAEVYVGEGPVPGRFAAVFHGLDAMTDRLPNIEAAMDWSERVVGRATARGLL
ncbi:hypothetical protein CcI49_02710 [Frankia sp. CcI49]|uniref:hypothetical protein n=1 Tax=unclassified Frankia TaxID=2632575 RepID=UPI0006C9EA82|nr:MULTISPECIES: hypothetical protein [unclassified Frankia]KPM55627.1 hypothetical protein ACG83_10060 [Frankia sp. R43]ONH62306.1 hypothetical protein CcI49_02710 [Frankia sp. CcI49]